MSQVRTKTGYSSQGNNALQSAPARARNTASARTAPARKPTPGRAPVRPNPHHNSRTQRPRPAPRAQPAPRMSVKLRTVSMGKVLKATFWMAAFFAAMFLLIDRNAKIAKLNTENQQMQKQITQMEEQTVRNQTTIAMAQDIQNVIRQAEAAAMNLPSSEQTKVFTPIALPAEEEPAEETPVQRPLWIQRIFG